VVELVNKDILTFVWVENTFIGDIRQICNH